MLKKHTLAHEMLNRMERIKRNHPTWPNDMKISQSEVESIVDDFDECYKTVEKIEEQIFKYREHKNETIAFYEICGILQIRPFK